MTCSLKYNDIILAAFKQMNESSTPSNLDFIL